MILFILGAQKTATSRVALMLNCQKEIFIAYEWQLHSGQISRHGQRFLNAYPEARRLFHWSEDLSELYTDLQGFLRQHGHPAEIVGDKIPGIHEPLFSMVSGFKVIFTIRDVRTWLCKDDIQKKFMTQADAVPAALDYTAHFLRSFLLPDVLHLRMEDIVADSGGTLERIGAFIHRDMRAGGDRWWERIEALQTHDLYKFDRWWEGRRHGTAALASGASDTIVETNPHPFWDELRPIFDKYYAEPTTRRGREEILRDVAKVQALAAYSPLPLETLYGNVRCIQLVEDDRPLKKRLKSRIRERLGLIKR